jgi:hypothetical protein
MLPEHGILTILAATVRDFSFWTGLVTVFAFALGRFSEKQFDEENIDPPLPSRYFTSRFRYYSSSFVFAGVYAFLYVSLILLGSIPVFQGFLKTFFGSASSMGASQPNVEIGTPAWAAMVIVVIAPAWPLLRQVETSVRHWLQEFSDTPFKARELAEEIIQAMLSSQGTPSRLEQASQSALIDVFDRLEELRRELTASGRIKRDQGYRAFFSENGEILTRTIDQFRAIQAELAALSRINLSARPSGQDQPPIGSPSPPLTHHAQSIVLVRRLARLIACSLLFVESQEYSVRERLRQMPQLSDFPRASFQFTMAQVFIGLFFIFISAVLIGPLTNILINMFWTGVYLTLQDMRESFYDWGLWAAKFAIAFMLPLPLAAAIRLYLIDKAVYGRETLEWLESLTMVIAIFVGCFFLSTLPLVAAAAYFAGQEFGVTSLTVSLIWALPPAIVNTTIVFLSGVRWGQSRKRDAIMDFVIFAALGGAAGTLASVLEALASMSGDDNFGAFLTRFDGSVPYILTAAFVSGLNGALQCAASRVIETTAYSAVANRSQ